jgi:hypothetical protein
MRVILFLFCASLYSQVTYSPFSDTLARGNADISSALFGTASENITFLDYNDCNNCPLRAHVMAFIFSKLYPGTETGKAWIIADSKLSSKRGYYKTHKREFLNGAEQCPQWGFHVAPVIITGNDTIVIDPSTQSSPAPLSRWAADISGSAPAYLIIRERGYYSFPEDGNDMFNDTLKTWENKYIFLSPEAEINFLAERLTKAYHKIFDPVKFGYYKNRISGILNR